MTKKLYDLVGLTPYRALFLHLLLIGYPLRFGLFPTGWGNEWLSIPDTIIKPPCSIFHANKECSATEELAIRDFGARFISQYNLAWVVFLTMRTTTATTVAYHRILLALSLSSLIIMSWIQAFFHPTPKELEFDSDFFTSMVFYTLLAASVSLWTIQTHPYIPVPSMKWSIPANAMFCGAVSTSTFYCADGLEASCKFKGTLLSHFLSSLLIGSWKSFNTFNRCGIPVTGIQHLCRHSIVSSAFS